MGVNGGVIAVYVRVSALDLSEVNTIESLRLVFFFFCFPHPPVTEL